MRSTYVNDLIYYINNSDSAEFDTATMGIYGQLGFEIEDTFRLDGGYMWPWDTDPVSGAISWTRAPTA